MNSYLLISVLIMAICTYIPRMLPLTFLKKKISSKWIQSLLYYVPYAVLAALTFPSIFYSTNSFMSALIGCLVAIYFSYQGKGLVFVACMAILTVLICQF